MKSLACVLAAASIALVWAGVSHSDETTDARAVVDKAIQAMGGEARLEKLKASTWKEKGTYYGMGDGLPYMGTYAIQWPDKFRMEIQGVFTIVLNGDKGWIKAQDETKEMTKEQLSVQQFDHKAGWIASLLPLKDKTFTLKALKEAKVEDRPALVVQVTRKDYPEVKLFFDAKTNLLVKSAFRTKAAEQGYKEVTLETYYENYQAVEGAKVPGKLVMKRDDKVFVEAQIEEMKAAASLDPKVFAMP